MVTALGRPAPYATRRGASVRWRGRVVAALAGGGPVLAFPEPGLWPLAWVALVPLLQVVRMAPTGRDAALRAWWGAGGFVVAMHHWLLPNLGPGLLLVAATLGALWAPWGLAVRALLGPPVTAPRLAAALVVLPAGWVALESVRSLAALGGPWGLLGASQWSTGRSGPLGLAAVGGVWLVSYALVTANVGVLAAAARRVPTPTRLLGVLAATAALAAGPLAAATLPAPPSAGTLRLAAVQPGVVVGPAARLAEGERITRGLPAGLDLVVWAESSVGYDLAARPDVRDRLLALARDLDVDLLVNIDARTRSGAIEKRSVLLGPDGERGAYTKTRLVPFGEYLPLRPLLGWLTAVSRAADEDRGRGSGPAVLDSAGARLGPLVCFESAFPDLARAVVRAGADVVVYQSATSTFQESWAPEQHAALAAVRAVEVGRPVVHATLTGQTAVYDARGRRLATLGTERSGAVVVDLPLTSGTTPFVVVGQLVPVLAWLVVGAALAWAAVSWAGRARAGVPTRAWLSRRPRRR